MPVARACEIERTAGVARGIIDAHMIARVVISVALFALVLSSAASSEAQRRRPVDRDEEASESDSNPEEEAGGPGSESDSDPEVEAEADSDSEDEVERDEFRVEAHFLVGYFGELGLGGRAEIPLATSGIVDGVADDIRLSVGIDALWFYHSDGDGFGVYPILALQWNFYLGEDWSIFVEAGLGFVWAPNRQRFWDTFIAPYGGAGVRHHFTHRNAIFLRAGFMPGAQLGITF